ncbi:MAG: hypothetical protein JXR76_11365 [Deltaproteobacteria bacterium]|nr:hypothetical protein [Deltaproteobacteria bacterium]
MVATYNSNLKKTTKDNDGCSADCHEESGYSCLGAGMCKRLCGDGYFHNLDEPECDDGNNLDGDGCSADCNLEDGWLCLNGHVRYPPLT